MKKKLPILLFFVLLGVGIAVRLLGAWWYCNDINADYAVIVEMARHIASFSEWPVFFYGQPYMGSLEPTVSALFAMVSDGSTFAICLGTVVFGVLLLLAVYRWARDTAGPWAGLASMAFLLIGPLGFFHYQVSPRGGYALALWLLAAMLHEGSRLAADGRETVDAGSLPANVSRRTAWLGLLGGLAFWNFWLALPAFAAAGFIAWAGLGRRIFRFRVWGPGALAFVAGSLPFWIWNACHGWASVSHASAPASDAPPQTLAGIFHTARVLCLERIPSLFRPGAREVSDPWTPILVLGVLLIVVFSVAVLRRAPRDRWTLRAALLSIAFLAAGFCVSSFGHVDSPRYLLPLLPPLAVLLGVSLVRSVERFRVGNGRWTRAWTGAGSVLLLAILLTHVAASLRTLPLHAARVERAEGRLRQAAMLQACVRSEGIDAVLADYPLWGLNWAFRDEVPVTCPISERYRPFRVKAEDAENPAVLENFRGFDHFLKATGGTAAYSTDTGFRLHSGIKAPRADVSVLPNAAIADVLGDRGISLFRDLADGSDSTYCLLAAPPHSERTIEIQLREPVPVAGIRFWVRDGLSYDEVSVEGLIGEEGTWKELVSPCVDSFFHWSGEAFFWGGAQHRTDVRFAPETVSRLRLRFQWGARSRPISFREIEVLVPAPQREPADWSAVAERIRAAGLRRVYSDRGPARRLRPLLPSSVRLYREPLVYGTDQEDELRLAIAPDTGILVFPADAFAVRTVLEELRCEVDETRVGGLVLFTFRNVPESVSAYRGLRFYGTAIFRDSGLDEAALRDGVFRPGCPPALDDEPDGLTMKPEHDLAVNADFPGAHLRLEGFVEWPDHAIPAGQPLVLEALWSTAPDDELPHGLMGFFHFLQDGKIRFQRDEFLHFESVGCMHDGRLLWTSVWSVDVPPDFSGSVIPAFGLSHPGFLNRREPPTVSSNPSIGIGKKRLLLPPITISRP